MNRGGATLSAARAGVRVAVRLALSHPARVDRGSERFALGAPPNVSYPQRHFGVRP